MENDERGDQTLRVKTTVLGLATSCGANGMDTSEIFTACAVLAANLTRASEIPEEDFIQTMRNFYSIAGPQVFQDIRASYDEGVKLRDRLDKKQSGGMVH